MNEQLQNLSRLDQAKNYAVSVAKAMGQPVGIILRGRQIRFEGERDGQRFSFDGPTFTERMPFQPQEMQLDQIYIVRDNGNAWSNPYNFSPDGRRRRGPGRARDKRSR